MSTAQTILPSVVQPPTIAFAPRGAATPTPLAALPCPNCGSRAAKTLVLTVDVQLPDNPAKRLRVLHCPDCTAHFYDDQVPPDYAEPALNNRGRVPFYVQQGAGVSLITRPLAQVRRPPGSAYMEVGCGYGFSLDFALNTRGWRGIGIDPAPLAALGRDALGLPVELRYLRDDDEARGTMDVVMGSEVIEHVTSPAAFVRTLRAMLKPGGVLVLTTPNGDDIAPDTAVGIIVPLLSPSLHLVIQNRASLAGLLQQAGFAHVEVQIDSHSLVAFASDSPLDIERDEPTLRRALREHLLRRAQTADPATDVFLGFAGRAFCESVNDGDMAAADQAWALLVPAMQARFGLVLHDIKVLPARVATCGLEEMATLVPLNLGSLLYLHGIRQLAAGTPRTALEPQFLLAAEAAAAMRRALGELAMEDGQTEDIEWTARAEALLCAAASGAADLADRFRALPPAPNGGVERRQEIALRAMTQLVNGGSLDEGRALVKALQLERAAFTAPGAPLSVAERDALFCLAVLDVQTDAAGRPLGDPARAQARMRRVRLGLVPGGDLWWAALRGEAQALGLLQNPDAQVDLAEEVANETAEPEVAQWALMLLVNASRYDAARALARRAGLDRAAFTQPGMVRALSAAERDVVFGLAMLDIQPGPNGRASGELAMARARFLRVRRACDAGSDLWVAALRGELHTLDMMGEQAEAASLTTDVEAFHPDLTLPPDILARIGKG